MVELTLELRDRGSIEATQLQPDDGSAQYHPANYSDIVRVTKALNTTGMASRYCIFRGGSAERHYGRPVHCLEVSITELWKGYKDQDGALLVVQHKLTVTKIIIRE